MTVWIVHREPAVRAALARRLGLRDAALGPPSARAFAGAAPPRAVLLAFGRETGPERAFAEDVADRFPAAGLVLVHPAERAAEVEVRFAGLPHERLAFPPGRTALRTALARQAAARSQAPEPAGRGLIEERFARWFADLPLPPPEAELWQRPRVLLQGEPGSGRMLLARVLHERGRAPRGSFVHVPCTAALGLPELSRALADGAPEAARALTLCLEGVDALAPPVQRALCSWVELGPPQTRLASARLRWIAIADARGPGLEESLAEAFLEPAVRVAPLRERRGTIAGFVRATAERWADASGRAPRRFSSEALARLEEDPWPGNLRELESAVVRLAAAGEGPVERAEVEALLAGEAREPAAPPPGEAEAPSEPAGPQGPPPGGAREAETAEAGGVRAQPSPGEAAPGAAPGPPEASARGAAAAPELPRLARSLAHELRNPLTGIRTFAALLPERFEDAEFREGFRSRVEEGVGRMEQTLDRLQDFAALGAPEPRAVDVAQLLGELLEARRPEIQRRRLLVLRELETALPFAEADPARLRFALGALLDRALAWMPERADLYVASRHRAAAEPEGAPRLRVLLRFHHPDAGAIAAAARSAERDVSLRENAVELALADAALRSEGGGLTVDAAGDETLFLIDLPAAPAASHAAAPRAAAPDA